MKQYKCEKHGELLPSERVAWLTVQPNRRWCLYCMNNFLDRELGILEEIEKEKVDAKPDES